MKLENRLEDLINNLIDLGMMPLEARMYVLLFLGGPTDLKSLEMISGVKKDNLVVTLNNMLKKGYIMVDYNQGGRITAVSPEYLIQNLRKKEEERLRLFYRRSDEVLKELKEKLNQNTSITKSDEDDFIKYIEGEEIFEKMKNMIRNSSKEIIRIISSTGIELNWNNGTIAEELKASKRGVKIRVITDINEKNIHIILNYMTGVEIRHFAGASYITRFVITDRSETIVMTSQPSVFNQEYFAFYTKSKKIISSLAEYFEATWQISANAKSIINNLNNVKA